MHQWSLEVVSKEGVRWCSLIGEKEISWLEVGIGVLCELRCIEHHQMAVRMFVCVCVCECVSVCDNVTIYVCPIMQYLHL